jgi:hypothetical protein
MSDEELWNIDLIDLLKEKLASEFADIKVSKERILKDVSLFKDKTKNKLQFGFTDQDVVFYRDELNIESLLESESIKIPSRSKLLIIPKLVLELKYNGIHTHDLVSCSEYASDIKTVFPDCKYWLVLRYKKTSSENKLKRHGKNFDKIIFFEDDKKKKSYKEGDFLIQLENDNKMKKIFNDFIFEIKNTLNEENAPFIK